MTENNLFDHEYVLVDNGIIYEINPALTLDFASSGGNGTEYIINNKTNTLMSRYNYTDVENSIPGDISYASTEFEVIGKVVKVGTTLDDFMYDTSLNIKSIEKVSKYNILEFKTIMY